MAYLVQARDLTVTLQRPIFEPLSFEIAPQDRVVILGLSGSGKSALLKLLAGLLQPTTGELEVRTRHIGMLFQQNALFNSLSVVENLLFPMRERTGLTGRSALDQAHAMLERVGLRAAAQARTDELSGGMQKRLGIARALIVKTDEPELILYDEPTAGLDPVTSHSISQMILEFAQERGTTFVAVTNDLARARELGSRIFLLAPQQHGQPLSPHRLLGGGGPESLLAPRDPAFRQFVSGDEHGPLTDGALA